MGLGGMKQEDGVSNTEAATVDCINPNKLEVNKGVLLYCAMAKRRRWRWRQLWRGTAF
jgi:hypothetical protein